ncbi:hypothetical protein LQW54_013342 [Pestalotiopsis sp. IQ-011]
MSGPPPPKPGSGGLSLYADLLDPPGDSSASISRGPQLSQQALDAVKEQEAAVAAKKQDAALRFQPIQNIRRPQQKTQKPKAAFPKAAAAPGAGSATASGNAAVATTGAPAPAPVKSSLADWTNTEEDDFMYEDRRPRGNNKKKQKKHNAPVETDWNEIYDPSRPTNVDEYLRSDERIMEVREWKALLYRHRRPADRKRQSSWDSDEDEEQHRPAGNQFAPPAAYSFAPPPPSPPSAAAAPVPDDKTGDDAYARRLAMSQGIPPPPSPPEPSHAGPETQSPVPPPPPPPEPEHATISRAPVRYAQPEPTDTDAMDQDVPEPQTQEEDADAPRSNRPGQKGFAARLMSKYGWSKGQGLGAEGTGMLAPLRVQVEKRKKNENGGWAEPGGRGKIIQPKADPNANSAAPASSSDTQEGKFGPMSNVIVLRHMLDHIADAQQEMEDGLGQEIGEECGDKYGRVERIYIDTAPGGPGGVYIKFVDTVSALRAVNALDGRVFAGSSIEPRFYDLEAFEKGVYE